jgi:hypothetical protein
VHRCRVPVEDKVNGEVEAPEDNLEATAKTAEKDILAREDLAEVATTGLLLLLLLQLLLPVMAGRGGADGSGRSGKVGVGRG